MDSKPSGSPGSTVTSRVEGAGSQLGGGESITICPSSSPDSITTKELLSMPVVTGTASGAP